MLFNSAGLGRFDECSHDDRENRDQEREEGPGDELQRVDLQGSGDEDPGNRPRDHRVDGGPGVIQDPGQVFTRQAQVIEGVPERLAGEDDGQVVFADHQIDPDTGDRGCQRQPPWCLDDAGQVVDDRADDVELDQKSPESQGEDDQGQGGQHAGNPTLGEQGVDRLVTGVGNVTHHDGLGNGRNASRRGVQPAEEGRKERTQAQRRDSRDLENRQDDQQDDRQEGPAGDPEAISEPVHHLVDGGQADVFRIKPENRVGDHAEEPGWDVSQHQGLDVLVDVDVTDTGGQVGGAGQWGNVRTAKGTGDNHPGGQTRVDL